MAGKSFKEETDQIIKRILDQRAENDVIINRECKEICKIVEKMEFDASENYAVALKRKFDAKNTNGLRSKKAYFCDTLDSSGPKITRNDQQKEESTRIPTEIAEFEKFVFPLKKFEDHGWKRHSDHTQIDQFVYSHEERDKTIKSYADVEKLMLHEDWFNLQCENFYFSKTNSEICLDIYTNDEDVLKFDPTANINKENTLIQVCLKNPDSESDPSVRKKLEKIKGTITSFMNNDWILDYEIHEKDRNRALFNGKEDLDFLECCDCTDGCRTTKCSCRNRTYKLQKLHKKHKQAVEFIDTAQSGYQYNKLTDYIQTGIFECNSRCACNSRRKLCSNRVVQKGIVQPLQLFHDDLKAWGVRARGFIPAGSFISTYLGVYINQNLEKHVNTERKFSINTIWTTEKQADFRAAMYTIDSNYIQKCEEVKSKRQHAFDKDGFDSGCEEDVATMKAYQKMEGDHSLSLTAWKRQTFAIDAFDKGNLGRFLNHRCGDPNVRLQSVFTNHQDYRIPVQALFAVKNIAVGEELVWDYSYPRDDLIKYMKCQCGSNSCPNKNSKTVD